MVDRAASDRNGSAMTKKKTKMAIAATSAPISGRASTVDRRDRCGGRSSFVEGEVWVATAWLMARLQGWWEPGKPTRRLPRRGGQRVLLAAYLAICSMLLLSTNDGPVRTGRPPPTSLPLVRLSHSASTAS